MMKKCPLRIQEQQKSGLAVPEGQESVIPGTDRQTYSLHPPTESSDFNSFVSYRLPHADGVYIKGKVNGVDVHVTANTGASHSIISYHVYEKSKLQGRSRLHGAGGSSIDVHGKGMFDLHLGTLSLKKELLVADIQDEMLLGVDILQNQGDEKSDLLLSKGVIRFKGHEIPCI